MRLRSVCDLFVDIHCGFCGHDVLPDLGEAEVEDFAGLGDDALGQLDGVLSVDAAEGRDGHALLPRGRHGSVCGDHKVEGVPQLGEQLWVLGLVVGDERRELAEASDSSHAGWDVHVHCARAAAAGDGVDHVECPQRVAARVVEGRHLGLEVRDGDEHERAGGHDHVEEPHHDGLAELGHVKVVEGAGSKGGEHWCHVDDEAQLLVGLEAVDGDVEHRGHPEDLQVAGRERVAEDGERVDERVREQVAEVHREVGSPGLDAPLAGVAVEDVEDEAVELREGRPLLPEHRVDGHRESCADCGPDRACPHDLGEGELAVVQEQQGDRAAQQEEL